MFTQPFIQAQIKENINAPRHWPFVRGIHRSPVNSPHKWPVTRKMLTFDDVIMDASLAVYRSQMGMIASAAEIMLKDMNNMEDAAVLKVIFKLILWTHILRTFSKIVIRWMPPNSIGDNSTLFQVMAWCHQATAHYLRQCWPRSLSPHGVTRPQWVRTVATIMRTIIVSGSLYMGGFA